MLTETDFQMYNQNATSLSFRIVPIWAVNFEKAGFSVVPRLILPYNGMEQSNADDGNGMEWGFGDMELQLPFSPKREGTWKYGFGPQFGFKTRQNELFAAGGNGIGLVGVISGDITKQISFMGFVSNLWSYDGTYNTTTIQPYLIYNFARVPGMYAGYMQAITINWKIDNGASIPLGLSIGKSWAFGKEYGFDFNVGYYYYAAKPTGSLDHLVKFGIGMVFP
jgi:hypothetical protein